MSININALINEIVVDMAIDRTKRIWGDDAIRNAIKESLKVLQSRCFFRLPCNSGDETINLTANKENYTIDNLDDINEIYVDGTPLIPKRQEDIIALGEQRGKPRYYYLDAGELRLFPIPDDSYELRALYSKILVLGDEDIEINISKQKFGEFLKLYSGYYLFLGKADVMNQQRAAAKKLLWESIIADIITTHVLQDTRGQLGDRGLGRKRRRRW